MHLKVSSYELEVGIIEKEKKNVPVSVYHQYIGNH